MDIKFNKLLFGLFGIITFLSCNPEKECFGGRGHEYI